MTVRDKRVPLPYSPYPAVKPTPAVRELNASGTVGIGSHPEVDSPGQPIN